MRGLIKTISLVFTIASSVAGVDAFPTGNFKRECTTLQKWQSWHDMTDEDKISYLDAQKCVMTSPAKLGILPGAKTRWDELSSLHQIHSLQIHSTGTFLPWHRYLLQVHRHLLHECGWEGGVPYWDEPRDAGNFTASPVLDPVLGFGGTGRGFQSCVQDGPFANLTVNIGPGFTTQPRCLNRRISEFATSGLRQTAVAAALNHPTYDEMWRSVYGGPHLMGHVALSMMNGDTITSSGDPIFFLHHAFVDKLWWDWQTADPGSRLWEMGGPNDQDPAVGFLEFPGNMTQEARMFGTPTAEMAALAPDPRAGDDGGNVTTLNHVLTSMGIIPDAAVGDVMDIRGGLCVEYV